MVTTTEPPPTSTAAVEESGLYAEHHKFKKRKTQVLLQNETFQIMIDQKPIQ